MLEPVWMASAPNSRERYLVQAIIQIANASLKAELGKPRAAAKLVAIAEGLLGRSGYESVFGLQPSEMRVRLAKLDDSNAVKGAAIARAVFE